MRHLLLITLLALVGQSCCRVISSRSDESLGDDKREAADIKGFSSHSDESLGDDKQQADGIEGFSSHSDESLGDDKQGSVAIEGISGRSDESLTEDSDEVANRKSKVIGSREDDDSVENESEADTKDSLERASHSETQDSDEVANRKSKVIVSREDDGSMNIITRRRMKSTRRYVKPTIPVITWQTGLDTKMLTSSTLDIINNEPWD